MNKAILLKSDDWEGLYVNGELVQEGHTLNQGYSRIQHFIKLSKMYNFKLEDMKEISLNYEDVLKTEYEGNFPQNISGFICKYDN